VAKGTMAIAGEALQTAMCEVKELAPGGTHKALGATLKETNQWCVGWPNHDGLTHCPPRPEGIWAHYGEMVGFRVGLSAKAQAAAL